MQQLLAQAHKACGLTDPAVDLLLAQLHVLRAEGNILIDRLLKELILRVLKHQTHMEFCLPDAGLALPDVTAVEQDLAGGGLKQSVQMLDQGGFAGAGMAHDADILTGIDGKINIRQSLMLKRCPLTVNAVQLPEFKYWFQSDSSLFRCRSPSGDTALSRMEI